MNDVPNARACHRRLREAIDGEASARNRLMLDIYRRHWWGEVTNDIDMIMATLPERDVHYRFDGHPFLMGEVVEFFTAAEARALYQSVIGQGVNTAGPFENERWAFADWGLVFEATLHGVYYGSMFDADALGLDPSALYWLSYPSVSLHPMDVDRKLMLGEIVYSGKPTRIEPVGDDVMKAMIGD
jgi:hypothetical protein